MNPILSLHIDRAPCPLRQFGVPGISLSSARVGMRRHSFVFTIDAKRMIEFLEPAYAAWVRESKRDDELCGEPQDVLAQAGYPDLLALVETPELLQLVLGYLEGEFLGKLTWDGVSQIKYWLDNVTGCSGNDKVLKLSGICYSEE